MTYIFMAGHAAFIAGIALLSIPAAFIIGGASIAALAFLYDRGRA